MSNVIQAVVFHDYKWPKQLTSGVMFFNGQRITLEEFHKTKEMLK